MNRRWQLNVLLIVVVSILAAIAVFRPGIEKPQPKPRLSAIRNATVDKVVLQRPHAPTVEIVRHDNDRWFITRPRKGRTNPFVVSSLLRIIRARVEQELPADAAGRLGDYGLDRPQATVRFGKDTIRFGDTNPLNNQQYILFRKRVSMIDKRYFWAVTRPTTEYLSKRLIEAGRKPRKVQLPDFTLELVKGSWQVRPPRQGLTADRIKQLADDWVNAQALAVKPYDGNRVLRWVRITFAPAAAGSETTLLRIGIVSRTPELVLYRSDEGLQYHFPRDLDKRLFSFADNSGSPATP